jgi:hypothetical protein
MLANSSSQSKFFSTYSSLKHRQSSLDHFKTGKISSNLKNPLKSVDPFNSGKSTEAEKRVKSRKLSNFSKTHKKNSSNPLKFPESQEKTLKYSKSRKTSKSKNLKSSHKRSTSSGLEPLAPVKGKNVQKAPKIFENQIFSDLYDEEGNHDRVLDTSLDRTEEGCEYVSPDLLKLPSVGRNLFNQKKIVF